MMLRIDPPDPSKGRQFVLYMTEAVIAQGPILGGDPGPALLPTAPVHSDPGSPAGIWTRTSPPVTASVLPLDYGAVSAD
jgi:hypothetical protein